MIHNDVELKATQEHLAGRAVPCDDFANRIYAYGQHVPAEIEKRHAEAREYLGHHTEVNLRKKTTKVESCLPVIYHADLSPWTLCEVARHDRKICSLCQVRIIDAISKMLLL